MIPKSQCLECNQDLWDESPPFQPKKGDSLICIFCGCMMEFGNKLKFIKADKITQEMKESSALIKFLNAMKANPFNGDPDRYNVRTVLVTTH